ncbi:THO complex subunit 4A-like [Salvia splendens]|uniref:THO complex subunit 4A-like n=1 Tax=Salvia splendens TaxID=180675 RepID=UPI001C26D1D9|nr:THO complex subunit 4A-like [Salvia splendens]
MSGAALDMSLDDLIKNNKKSGAARGGRGRAAGPGPARRPNNRFANRVTPYSAPKAPETAWGHDMFAAGGRSSNIETGTKLYISNLDYGVSNEDIKELFSEVGDLKRNVVHYDRSGRSKGTAEVVFSRRQDAMAAIKRYNNVQLDGKPMKLELVGTNITTPGAGAGAFPPAGAFGDSNVAPRSGQGRGGFGRPRGGRGGRGFGRGRGQGSGQGRGGRGGEKVSAEDLDADLEKYHADAMQTN